MAIVANQKMLGPYTLVPKAKHQFQEMGTGTAGVGHYAGRGICERATVSNPAPLSYVFYFATMRGELKMCLRRRKLDFTISSALNYLRP